MMAINMKLRDARLEVMRGNLDKSYVQPITKPVEEIKPQPAPQPQVVVDLAPIAEAMRANQDLIANAMQSIQPKDDPAPVKQWTFRITERDRMGNIIAFVAEGK